MAHWTDEGVQRFEFGFKDGDSEDGQTCLVMESGKHAAIIMTRQALEKFIQDAQLLLGANPITIDVSISGDADPKAISEAIRSCAQHALHPN